MEYTENARSDRVAKLIYYVDRIASNDDLMDTVMGDATKKSGGPGSKESREQVEDLHAAILAARDPELCLKWEKALDSWLDRVDGDDVDDDDGATPKCLTKIMSWSLEANAVRSGDFHVDAPPAVSSLRSLNNNNAEGELIG